MSRCRYAPRKSQPVNIGTVIIVKYQAGTIVTGLHQLIVAHLTTQGHTHLVDRCCHEKVTIDCTHHLVAGP